MSSFQRAILATNMALCSLIAVNGAHADSFSAHTITLDKAVHFYAPDGSDILTPPGDYQVESELSSLRLSELAGEKSFRIAAIVTDLDVDANDSIALAVRFREDEYHIILLMPGRKVHEAVGSSSGIFVRDTAVKPLTAAQIKSALGMKRTMSP